MDECLTNHDRQPVDPVEAVVGSAAYLGAVVFVVVLGFTLIGGQIARHLMPVTYGDGFYTAAGQPAVGPLTIQHGQSQLVLPLLGSPVGATTEKQIPAVIMPLAAVHVHSAAMPTVTAPSTLPELKPHGPGRSDRTGLPKINPALEANNGRVAAAAVVTVMPDRSPAPAVERPAHDVPAAVVAPAVDAERPLNHAQTSTRPEASGPPDQHLRPSPGKGNGG